MALSVTLGFHGQFTASKVGKTGLTVTIDIKSVKKSDGTVAAVVTAGSATENWRGVYFYRLTGADPETYDYEAVFITSDATVDQKEVPALWTQYSAAVVTSSGAVSNVTLTATTTTNTDMITQPNVRAAVGLGSANLDTQIATLATLTKLLRYFQLALRKDTAVATDLAVELAALNANTGTGVGAYDNTADSLTTLGDKASLVYSFLTGALTESYPALGAAPTLTQVQFVVLQLLSGNFSISGNTITIYKLDGVTVAMTFTLNANPPTARTRAS